MATRSKTTAKLKQFFGVAPERDAAAVAAAPSDDLRVRVSAASRGGPCRMVRADLDAALDHNDGHVFRLAQEVVLLTTDEQRAVKVRAAELVAANVCLDPARAVLREIGSSAEGARKAAIPMAAALARVPDQGDRGAARRLYGERLADSLDGDRDGADGRVSLGAQLAEKVAVPVRALLGDRQITSSEAALTRIADAQQASARTLRPQRSAGGRDRGLVRAAPIAVVAPSAAAEPHAHKIYLKRVIETIDAAASTLATPSRQQTAFLKDVFETTAVVVSLSALSPTFGPAMNADGFAELVTRVVELCAAAQLANCMVLLDDDGIGVLDTTLDVFEQVLQDQQLHDWFGVGLVVNVDARNQLAVLRYLRHLLRGSERMMPVMLAHGRGNAGAWISANAKHQLRPSIVASDHLAALSWLAGARFAVEASDRIYPILEPRHPIELAAAEVLTAGRAARVVVPTFAGAECANVMRQSRISLGQRLTLGTRDDAVSAMADQMVAQCRHHDADDRRHPDLLTLTDPAELISLLEAGDMNSDAGITPQHAAAGRWSRCTEARLAGMMERARADVARINAKNIADRDRDAPNVGDRLVLAVPSPSDRQSMASVVQMTDAADVGSIVDVGVQAFAGWNATGLTERARIAATFANLLERRQDELIAAMVLSGGMRIVDAHADWQGAISDAREMIANVLDARASSPTDRAATGLGLMLVVPDATSLRSRVRLEVAALMAGNSVISATLPTAARLADLVRDLWGEAQLGEAQLQIVHVDQSTLTRFGCDAGIAGFASATGESTLQRVMSARAMASVSSIPALDLSAPIAVAIHDGTVDPGLVIADLSRALGASQSETGWPVRKVFVDEGQFEPICKALATAAFRAVPGPSWLAETTVGPLPTREDLDAALADKVRLADTCTVVADPADTTYGDGFHCMPGVYAAERGSGARPAVGGPLIVVEPFDATDLDDLVANVRRVSDNAALALYSAGHGLSQALADELQPVALAHTTGASPVAGNTTLGSAVIRSRATRTPNARGCPDPLSLPFSRSVRPIIVD